jgi:DNA-binding transcriptional LysR family regulator
MVEVGLGWSVLPETLAEDLHIMPFEHSAMHRDLGYICHTKKTLSNAAKAFLQLLDNEAARQ